MSRYLYTVWFRDHSMLPDDQDYEWPACILIVAASPDDARHWGDHLAARYCRERPDCQFLNSSAEPEPAGDPGHTPVVGFGEEASDEVIGW